MDWRKFFFNNFFFRKTEIQSKKGGVTVHVWSTDIKSKTLNRSVRIDIYYPEPNSKAPLPLLIFNDGQDMKAVNLVSTLNRLLEEQKIRPGLVVGIHAGDRMQEYGTAQQVDYKKRGSKAQAYTNFITKELLPFLRKKYKLSPSPADNAIAGFSLGGLSAFDIAWHHNNIFGKVGVFSGSFWWRSQAFTQKDPDAHRIIPDTLAISEKRVGLKFWLQTGTNDEQEDRNNNGIIDAIDDTLDVIRGLKKLGYQEGVDIKYLEVIDGEHNPGTWGKVMPDFLHWVETNK